MGGELEGAYGSEKGLNKRWKGGARTDEAHPKDRFIGPEGGKQIFPTGDEERTQERKVRSGGSKKINKKQHRTEHTRNERGERGMKQHFFIKVGRSTSRKERGY